MPWHLNATSKRQGTICALTRLPMAAERAKRGPNWGKSALRLKGDAVTISMNRGYFMNGASRAVTDSMAVVASEERAAAGGEEKSADFGIIVSSEFLANLTVPRGMFGQLPRQAAIVIPPPVIDGSCIMIGDTKRLTQDAAGLPDNPGFEK